MSPFPRLHRCSLGFGLIVAGATQLLAQDVTVCAIPSTRPESASDVAAQLKRPLRPEFPKDLRKTAEIGWAAVSYVVDEKGGIIAWRVDATQPALAAAVEMATANRGKFMAARRGDVPVISSGGLAVVFNPASAASEIPDATPRLLVASPIVDPKLKNGPKDPPPAPVVIWGTIALDERGQVTAVRNVPGELQSLLDRSLQQWRFAPARRGGVAIAAEVHAPIIILPADRLREIEVQPRWVKRIPPEYPLAMRQSGLRGSVVVEFTVDIEGRVRDPIVITTLNPGFNEAALTAIRKWKFQPGKNGGVPVEVRLQQSIVFQLDQSGGGADGIVVQHKANQAKLPEALRYDVAPQTKALVMPVYPYALLAGGGKGKAQVSLLIGPDGKVVDTLIVKADHPELGFALQAAVELFEYTPALKAAAPTQALLAFTQEFSRDMESIVTVEDRAVLKLEKKQPEKILRPTDLDHKINVIHQRPPLYPRSLHANPVKGEAVIEFLIDEKGAVRLPRIISATKPQFGYAAVQAVSAWQFSPPLSKGKLGVTRVRILIGFSSPVAAESKPAS